MATVATHPAAADPTVAPTQAPPAQAPHAAETTSVPPETSTNGHGPREEVDPKVIKEREKQQKQCVQLVFEKRAPSGRLTAGPTLQPREGSEQGDQARRQGRQARHEGRRQASQAREEGSCCKVVVFCLPSRKSATHGRTPIGRRQSAQAARENRPEGAQVQAGA